MWYSDDGRDTDSSGLIGLAPRTATLKKKIMDDRVAESSRESGHLQPSASATTVRGVAVTIRIFGRWTARADDGVWYVLVGPPEVATVLNAIADPPPSGVPLAGC